MASSPSSSGRRRRLGELLVDAQLISEDQLKAALLEQRKWGGRLGRTVVEMGAVTESAMVAVLAAQLQLRTVDLDTVKLPPRVTDLLRLDLAERYGVFPLGLEGNTLHLATADPTNLEQIQELSFACAKRVQVAVATASSIDRAVRRYYFGEQVTPMETIHPRNLGVEIYELDERQPPAPAGPAAPTPAAAPPYPPTGAPPLQAAPSPAAQAVPGPPVLQPVPGPPVLQPVPGPPVLQPGPPTAVLATATSPSGILPLAAPPPAAELAELRRELTLLKEQVLALEGISASQVKALRALLELLIESGLVGRDEYLERLNARSE